MSTEATEGSLGEGPGKDRGRGRWTYHLTPKGEQHLQDLETVKATREDLYQRKATSGVTVLWDRLGLGTFVGSVLLTAPLLWFGLVKRDFSIVNPWFAVMGILAPLLLAGCALATVFVAGRERSVLESLFHVLDQKTDEAGILLTRVTTARADGARFQALLEGVTGFLKDGTVDFETRKLLWRSVTRSKELQDSFVNALKEGPDPDRSRR